MGIIRICIISIALISINFLIHLVQIIMLIKPGFLLKNFNSPSGYFLMAGFSILLFYLLGKVFSKKVLARGIKTYKESKVSSNASIIAFGYLILNIVAMSSIAGIRSWNAIQFLKKIIFLSDKKG